MFVFELHSSNLIKLKLSLDNINLKSADLKAVHISLRIRNENIVYFLYADVNSQHAGRSFVVPQNHLLGI